MKIVLIGYMGSGKSTVGRHLAASRDIDFIDLDDYIEAQVNLSIPEIFAQKGELFFRKKEHELLKEVLQAPGDAVISLGGGTPCYSGNMQTVLKFAPNTFYLMLPIPELISRLLPGKAGRPLIRDIPDEELPTFIGKHLFERRAFYELAPHTIACSGKTTGEVVGEIESRLKG